MTGGDEEMGSVKTTIAGVLASVAMLAKTFGLEIPTEVTDGILAVAMFAMGFFSKDK